MNKSAGKSNKKKLNNTTYNQGNLNTITYYKSSILEQIKQSIKDLRLNGNKYLMPADKMKLDSYTGLKDLKRDMFEAVYTFFLSSRVMLIDQARKQYKDNDYYNAFIDEAKKNLMISGESVDDNNRRTRLFTSLLEGQNYESNDLAQEFCDMLDVYSMILKTHHEGHHKAYTELSDEFDALSKDYTELSDEFDALKEKITKLAGLNDFHRNHLEKTFNEHFKDIDNNKYLKQEVINSLEKFGNEVHDDALKKCIQKLKVFIADEKAKRYDVTSEGDVVQIVEISKRISQTKQEFFSNLYAQLHSARDNISNLDKEAKEKEAKKKEEEYEKLVLENINKDILIKRNDEKIALYTTSGVTVKKEALALLNKQKHEIDNDKGKLKQQVLTILSNKLTNLEKQFDKNNESTINNIDSIQNARKFIFYGDEFWNESDSSDISDVITIAEVSNILYDAKSEFLQSLHKGKDGVVQNLVEENEKQKKEFEQEKLKFAEHIKNTEEELKRKEKESQDNLAKLKNHIIEQEEKNKEITQKMELDLKQKTEELEKAQKDAAAKTQEANEKRIAAETQIAEFTKQMEIADDEKAVAQREVEKLRQEKKNIDDHLSNISDKLVENHNMVQTVAEITAERNGQAKLANKYKDIIHSLCESLGLHTSLGYTGTTVETRGSKIKASIEAQNKKIKELEDNANKEGVKITEEVKRNIEDLEKEFYRVYSGLEEYHNQFYAEALQYIGDEINTLKNSKPSLTIGEAVLDILGRSKHLLELTVKNNKKGLTLEGIEKEQRDYKTYKEKLDHLENIGQMIKAKAKEISFYQKPQQVKPIIVQQKVQQQPPANQQVNQVVQNRVLQGRLRPGNLEKTSNQDFLQEEIKGEKQKDVSSLGSNIGADNMIKNNNRTKIVVPNYSDTMAKVNSNNNRYMPTKKNDKSQYQNNPNSHSQQSGNNKLIELNLKSNNNNVNQQNKTKEKKVGQYSEMLPVIPENQSIQGNQQRGQQQNLNLGQQDNQLARRVINDSAGNGNSMQNKVAPRQSNPHQQIIEDKKSRLAVENKNGVQFFVNRNDGQKNLNDQQNNQLKNALCNTYQNRHQPNAQFKQGSKFVSSIRDAANHYSQSQK